jgi:hypothetical protein
MSSRFAFLMFVVGPLSLGIASLGACNGLQGTVEPGTQGGATTKASGGSATGGGVGASGGKPATGGSAMGGQAGGGAGGTPASGGAGGAGGTTATGGSAAGGSVKRDAGPTRDASQIKDAPNPKDGEVGPIACDDITSLSRLGVWNYVDSTATAIQDVQLHLDVLNFTALSAQLSQVTVRYWFTDEDPETPNEIAQYYVPAIAGTIKTKFTPLNPPRKDANTVLEISFAPKPDAGLNFVETTKFDLAFHKANYKGTFDLSNDYSFDVTLQKKFGPNPKITAYIKGVLSWGCEPEVLPPPPPDAAAIEDAGASADQAQASIEGDADPATP